MLIQDITLDEIHEIHNELLIHIEINGYAIEREVIEAIYNTKDGSYSYDEIKKEIDNAIYCYDLTRQRVTRNIREEFDIDKHYSMNTVILAEI